MYDFKTKPFDHQREIFDATLDHEAYGLFWEQGCGKTKPVIDQAAALFERDEIDCLLVVAPNGVHRNWITDEIVNHLPDRVAARTHSGFYQSPKARTKWHQRDMESLLKYQGLVVLTISYDGFMTELGKKLMWRFLKRRRVMYVLDEAHYIKTPGAKRTKSIIASAKYAEKRRLLTGTPIAQGPFDIYSQVRFLDDEFWKREKRIGNFNAFKMRYGIWRTREEVMREYGYDPGYNQLVSYRNVDELHEVLAKVGDRRTKDDVLDLPPKLFSKRPFEMTPQQSKAYQELTEDYQTQLENGEWVEADLAIVRLLRLQQITCGYVATDVEEPVQRISDKNPRLDTLVDITEGLGHKAIIWSRFRADVDLIMDALGGKAVRYDGQVDDDGRAKAKDDFQKGDAQFFVANPAAGATGLTLTAARTVVYYSNSFKLVDRLQSEDRAHRIGQEHPVNYIDIVAPGTIDDMIVKSLRMKQDIATQITGDKVKEWI